MGLLFAKLWSFFGNEGNPPPRPISLPVATEICARSSIRPTASRRRSLFIVVGRAGQVYNRSPPRIERDTISKAFQRDARRKSYCLSDYVVRSRRVRFLSIETPIQNRSRVR